MKTAISIPDPIYLAAEQLARRLGMTRSDLYATAVDTFVKAHQDDQITAELDQLYASEQSALDSVSDRLQALSVNWEEW
jgi:hypothetical protein